MNVQTSSTISLGHNLSVQTDIARPQFILRPYVRINVHAQPIYLSLSPDEVRELAEALLASLPAAAELQAALNAEEG